MSQNETQLRTMLSAISNAFPLPALYIDGLGKISSANDEATEIFGQSIVGKSYIAVLRQPILLDSIEKALKTRKATTSTYRENIAHNNRIHRVSIRPVLIERQNFFCISFEDMSDLKSAGVMKRDFVANVSHELRTPLTSVMGFLETLMGSSVKDEAVKKRFLTIMHNECERMNRIISGLLSLSKLEAEHHKQPVTTVDVSEVIHAVVEQMLPVLKENDIHCTLEGFDQPYVIKGEWDQIIQVFTNLIENAVKYGSKGKEIKLSARRIEGRLGRAGHIVQIDVEDKGDGIAPEHLHRLTERFYRIDSHRSREKGGTGLGLSIVKHILTRHRGKMTVESTVNYGSVFTIFLPLLV